VSHIFSLCLLSTSAEFSLRFGKFNKIVWNCFKVLSVELFYREVIPLRIICLLKYTLKIKGLENKQKKFFFSLSIDLFLQLRFSFSPVQCY
jgi:hypothetical protein